MDPRVDAYKTLLAELLNYQKALHDEVAKEQLNKLDLVTKDSWNNYQEILITKLLKRDGLITITSNTATLIRRIKALLKQDDLYLDSDGFITSIEY